MYMYKVKREAPDPKAVGGGGVRGVLGKLEPHLCSQQKNISAERVLCCGSKLSLPPVL